MKIGELAQRSGMASSAIRFYESSGLLPAARRGGNGYRIYDEDTLQRLLLIQTAQRLGFTLDVLRKLLAPGEELPHELVLQSMRERLAEIDAMQRSLAAQRAEMEALMQQMQAEWAEGRCLELAQTSRAARRKPAAGSN